MEKINTDYKQQNWKIKEEIRRNFSRCTNVKVVPLLLDITNLELLSTCLQHMTTSLPAGWTVFCILVPCLMRHKMVSEQHSMQCNLSSKCSFFSAAVHICYSPALVGPYWEKLCPRSRVRPEAAGRGPYSRPRAQFFLIRTDQGRQIKFLFISKFYF